MILFIKNITRRVVPLCALLLAFMSCAEREVVLSATGNPYELIVFATESLWGSAVGDTIKARFSDEIDILNGQEPIYDVRCIEPRAANSVILRHRNIIHLQLSKEYDRNKMVIERDKHAKGQLFVEIQSPGVDSAAAFLSTRGDDLLDTFNKLESQRMVTDVIRGSELDVEAVLTNRFGINMAIPSGWGIRKDEPNLLWIAEETLKYRQGAVVYTFSTPVDITDSSLYQQIIDQRNIAGRQIAAITAQSHITTETLTQPTTRNMVVNGREWFETKGLWRSVGDFSGGPFVNYTTYDDANGHYLSIDLYLYSPSPTERKRNHLRRLECLLETIVIPE